MTVIAIGISLSSAPAETLGSLSIPADSVQKALGEFISSSCVNEAVVLSTCNRTEIYIDAERFHDGYHDVRDALGIITGVPVDEFVDHLFVHYDDAAVSHLFEVTAGLDSAILGEHEILGQVRGSWETARAEGTTGSVLNPLFDHALRGGKRVRTETSIGRHTASLSHAAVSLITEHQPELDGRRVLLVGSGDAGTGVATALSKSASVELVVTNRTKARAEAVASDLAAQGQTVEVVDFNGLGDALADADIVISATAAPEFVIRPEHVGDGHRPRLFLDLAVPADVDPAVAAIDGCRLLALGDLQALANRGIERRKVEADAARVVLEDAMGRYQKAISASEVAPLLSSLHRWGDSIRTAELDRYRNRLGQLDPAQLEAVEAMSRAMVAKLLHPPSAELRSSAGTPRGQRLAEAVQELFDRP